MASAIAQQAAALCTAQAPRQQTRSAAKAFVGAPVQRKQSILGRSIVQSSSKQQAAPRSSALKVYAIRDGATLDRPLRVAVIGGGPSGACCAEVRPSRPRVHWRNEPRTVAASAHRQ
jgi:geranylgeranyl reductase